MTTSIEHDILASASSVFGVQGIYTDLEHLLHSANDEALNGLPSWPSAEGFHPVMPVQQQPPFIAPLLPLTSSQPLRPPSNTSNPLIPPPKGAQAVKKKGRDEAARSRRKQERKKQALRELEESLQKKTEEFKRLEQENLSLKHRHDILNRILAIRNHQLGILKQPPGRSLPVPTAASNSPHLPPPNPLTPETPASSDSDSAALQLAQLPRDVQDRLPQFPADTTISSPAIALLGTSAHSNFDEVPVEFFLEMTSSQFLALYKKHLFRLSEHLQVLESSLQFRQQQPPQGLDPGSSLQPLNIPLYLQPLYTQQPQQPQLQQLPQESSQLPASPAVSAAAQGLLVEACLVGRLYKLASIHHPVVVSKQMVRHLETGAEGVPPVEHWRMLLQTLALTPEQQLDLLTVGQLYKRLMATVLAERTKLYSALAASGHNVDTEKLNVMMHVPVECHLMRDLLRNLRQEKSLSWMLQGFFFGNSCTVLQFSKAIAYAYPYMPDAVAITMTLWDDMEAEGALPASLLSPP